MGFNIIYFYPFLGLFIAIYWIVKSNLFQNISLLLFGYVFYYSLDKNFIALLVFFTLFTFLTGLLIDSVKKSNKQKLTIISISICLLTLLTLKTINLSEIINSTDIQNKNTFRKAIIPLGISFYFIHGITYLSDIYTLKIKPEKNIINYAIFINFFPLLIAGPIERANNLLPQLKRNKTFDYHNATRGLKYILWGLVQKLIISNLCSPFSNYILDSPHIYSGSTIYLAILIYSINIYTDFSGYSNIAIGISKLLGFEIQANFNFPYFSNTIKSFWRRWHISLSNFFRDYIYIPLGGNSKSIFYTLTNTLIVFLLSGIWHGTSPNFIMWGIYHFSIFSISFFILRLNWKKKINPTLKKIISTWLTFNLISIGWIFFRSNSISKSYYTITKLTSNTLIQTPDIFPTPTILAIIIFMFTEWHWYKKGELFNTDFFNNLHITIRWSIYLILILLILFYSTREEQFIYFQF